MNCREGVELYVPIWEILEFVFIIVDFVFIKMAIHLDKFYEK